MFDHAAKEMKDKYVIASERISGVDDNMSSSHYHEFYELYYLETGLRKHLLGDQLFEIHSGEILLFEPYTLHHSFGDPGVPFCRLLIYFRKSEIQSEEIRQALHGTSGAYRFSTNDSVQFHRIMDMIHVELHQNTAFSDVYTKNLLNLLLILLIRNQDKHLIHLESTLVTDVISYIHQNYMNNLSLEKIADQFYISTYHLCHEFNKYTSTTIVHYINKTRIARAQQLLLTTSDTITEISSACGFSNLTHFGRVFRSLTGLSPSQWKKLQSK